jgi:hypothetical protein
MSDKKILVPEGMLTTVEFVALGRTMPRGGSILSDILEAALLWLDDELDRLVKGDPYINDSFCFYRSETLYESAVRSGFNKAIAEVRRIFLSTEPEERNVFQLLKGRTFTQEEADMVYDYVQRSVHGGRCPCMRDKKDAP